MKYPDVKSLLDAKNIPYEMMSAGEQLYINCPLCKSEKKKLTIQNATGLFTCFLCGEHGNDKKLLSVLSLKDKAEFGSMPRTKEPTYDPIPIDPEIVKEHHARLMANNDTGKDLRAYWNNRGITNETLVKFQLGWDGRNLTIPLIDASGRCMGIKLKPDPTRPSGSKGAFNVPGYKRMLFNEKVLKEPLNEIYICEGEPDCMLLNQSGLPAVTTTAGATGFDESWCKWFKEIKKIFICFDVDVYTHTGQKAARDLARKFNSYGIDVFVIRLPTPPLYLSLDKYDITDYLVKDKHTIEEFLRLATVAMPSVAPKKYKKDPLSIVRFYEGDQASKAYDNLYAQYGQGFSTGFDVLDKHFKMLPQHLYLISATTFSGKTLLSLQMAMRMAKEGKKVLFFALETGLNVVKTIRDFYGPDIFPKSMIFVDADSYILAETIERSLEKITDVDVVFIDHIHYFERDSNRSMTAQIDQIIVDLQTIAKSHMVPVVLVAHVRKLNEFRAPTIDDLKDSASLGQIPSVIIMIHRKRNSESEIERGSPEMMRIGHVFIRKNRITGSLFAEEFYIRKNQQFVFRSSDEWDKVLSLEEKADYIAQDRETAEEKLRKQQEEKNKMKNIVN